jgi:peptidoglycan/xylan/chitin deacetylase (PgdA/CDA1 family)
MSATDSVSQSEADAGMCHTKTETAKRPILMALVAALALVLPYGASAANDDEAPISQVLLTFDTELDPDEEAMSDLNIDVRATFFFTGAYAEAKSDLVRELAAAGHTIGSHSFHHDALPTLNEKHRILDLRLSRHVLEEITCMPIRWFRAPFLEIDEATIRQAAEAGYQFDSSEPATGARDLGLPVLGIASHEGRLVSDFDIFLKDELSDQEALDFMIAAYERHASAGRPFVVLLHPRIIAAHADVLHAFIAHATARGSDFVTADEYVRSLEERSAETERVGLWVDLGTESGDPRQLAQDAAAAGVTDVFLSAQGASGTNYLEIRAGERPVFDIMLDNLRAEGLRVHAIISVNLNIALAESQPDLAMVATSGLSSKSWVSPSNPAVYGRLKDLAVSLVRDRDIDGLLLDHLGYPNWNYDFSSHSLARFKAATDVTEDDPETILHEHYGAWITWRTTEIAQLVAIIEDAVRPLAGAEFEFGAVLQARSFIDLKSFEGSAQDYILLGPHLDLVVLADQADTPDSELNWKNVLFMARDKLGAATALVHLDLAGDAVDPTLSLDTQGDRMRAVAGLSDGVVVRPELMMSLEEDGSNVRSLGLLSGRKAQGESGRFRWPRKKPDATFAGPPERDASRCSSDG